MVLDSGQTRKFGRRTPRASQTLLLSEQMTPAAKRVSVFWQETLLSCWQWLSAISCPAHLTPLSTISVTLLVSQYQVSLETVQEEGDWNAWSAQPEAGAWLNWASNGSTPSPAAPSGPEELGCSRPEPGLCCPGQHGAPRQPALLPSLRWPSVNFTLWEPFPRPTLPFRPAVAAHVCGAHMCGMAQAYR